MQFFSKVDFTITFEGKLCEDIKNHGKQWWPIGDPNECKLAHDYLKKKYPNFFKDSTFVHASGDGVDLPFGCISDMVSQKHYVYWNPDGKTISSDPKLSVICKDSKGNYFVKTRD